MADDKAIEGAERKEAGVSKKKKQKRNIVSRIWNGLFRTRGDDFEKRLQYISKEEAAIIDRMKRRVQTWRLRSRQFILFSLFCEVLVVGFAIMMTRSTDLDWKIRAVYVLPMFVWPALSYFAHSALLGWTRRCDHKDQNTLERLRAERQTKIDELKERTNYYTTQQLIQRYDPDPAAKAAAATVLASKLGAESGLKMYWGEESTIHAPAGKSNDAEVVQQSGGLRKRKPLQTSISAGNTPLVTSGAVTPFSDGTRTPDSNQVVVDHHFPQGSSSHDGGWIARVAALLVGEDPTQSYALICGNCHMHNGLARKEDFQYITYYCPHCRALNRPKQSEETRTGCNTPHFGTLTATVSGDLMNNLSGSPRKSLLTSSSTTITAPVIEEKSENTEDADVVD